MLYRLLMHYEFWRTMSLCAYSIWVGYIYRKAAQHGKPVARTLPRTLTGLLLLLAAGFCLGVMASHHFGG